MDPASLAAAAVGFIVSYLQQVSGQLTERSGQAVADAAFVKAKALYARVRAKLAPDSSYGVLLQGVEETPEDTDRQESLKAALATMVAHDTGFEADLERLVAQAQTAGRVSVTATDVGVFAGRDAKLQGRYTAGRDMTIGDTSGKED
jgi:hypothetical protein